MRPGRGYPKVTGVLPIGLEKSTRIMPVVAHSVKEYVCVMELHGEVDEDKLRKALELFKGPIYQRPPLKSSVKRVLRVRKVHDIRLLETKGRHALLHVVSEPGTYMRKLCHDLGIVLGTGAHMRELRRTRTGPFSEDKSVTLQELSEAIYLYENEGHEELLRRIIHPVEVAVCELPKIVVKDTAVGSIVNGSPLYKGGIIAYTKNIETERWTALLTLRGELIGLGKPFREQSTHEDPLNSIRPQIVIMEPGKYPNLWKRRREDALLQSQKQARS